MVRLAQNYLLSGIFGRVNLMVVQIMHRVFQELLVLLDRKSQNRDLRPLWASVNLPQSHDLYTVFNRCPGQRRRFFLPFLGNASLHSRQKQQEQNHEGRGYNSLHDFSPLICWDSEGRLTLSIPVAVPSQSCNLELRTRRASHNGNLCREPIARTGCQLALAPGGVFLASAAGLRAKLLQELLGRQRIDDILLLQPAAAGHGDAVAYERKIRGVV